MTKAGTWRKRFSVRFVLALKVIGLFAPLIALGLIGLGLWQVFGGGAAMLTIGLLIWADHYMPSAIRPAEKKLKPGNPGVKIGRVPVQPFAVDPRESMRH